MSKPVDPISNDDPFDLNRFLQAQKTIFDRVLSELRNGQKLTHWMWFIFPQIDGLGHSPTTKFYAIKSIEEAQKYLDHPVLGVRLLECVNIILALEGRAISDIFDDPDDLKLKSCMTLFAWVAGPQSVFERVLVMYFHGKRDSRTLSLLEKLN